MQLQLWRRWPICSAAPSDRSSAGAHTDAVSSPAASATPTSGATAASASTTPAPTASSAIATVADVAAGWPRGSANLGTAAAPDDAADGPTGDHHHADAHNHRDEHHDADAHDDNGAADHHDAHADDHHADDDNDNYDDDHTDGGTDAVAVHAHAEHLASPRADCDCT